MFVLYVIMATKILSCQLIYPKYVIYKAVYLFCAKVHLKYSYKFKKISIGSTSARRKKYTLPCQKVSYKIKNSILGECYFLAHLSRRLRGIL